VPVLAQATTLPFRLFVAFDGSYQATGSEFRDARAFVTNAEEGRFDADYVVTRGPGFDVTAGAMVHHRLALAVSASRFQQSTPATLSGSVPHPLYFSRPRSLAGRVGELDREELGLHMQARGVVSSGRRLEISVFGGPSLFRISQAMVSDFDYGDEYPYDEVTFRAAETVRAEAVRLGFNVGTDATLFLTRQLGVGAGVQFSRGSVTLPTPGGDEQPVTVGGVRAGAGIRVRF
jgi:hypothetical protein